jgi:hypothetical protein
MDEFLHQAMAKFQENYKPVTDLSKSTHLFSTTEIFKALKELNPGADISKDDIFYLMEEYGYHWLPDPDKMSFSLKWMVQQA